MSFVEDNSYFYPSFDSLNDTYGVGKKVSEYICNLSFSEHFEPVHVRCYAFTGPYLSLDTSFAVGNFVADIISGKQIKLSGDGSQLRSLYVADVVVWMFTILGNGEPIQSYNVGGLRRYQLKI